MLRHLAESGLDRFHVGEAEVAAEAQGHVLGDRQRRHEHEMLVDHADAPPDRIVRRGDPHLFAVQTDRALVGPVEPVEDLHERALASPVLTEQRVDLTGLDRQIDVVVGDDAGETLRDPPHLEHGSSPVGLHRGTASYWPVEIEPSTIPAAVASAAVRMAASSA